MTNDPQSKPASPGRIAHIGAFSMPNWGDQLYPPILESLLSSSGIDAAISHFAPVPGTTTTGDPIRALRDVRSSGADVALVGGGDIIRFDNRTVALDHLSVPSSRRGSRLERFRARRFASRTFLEGPGAWVPASGWLDRGPSVMLSVGVHTVPDSDAARRAVRNYSAAWVRTQSGADRLAGAGIPKDKIVVAPDMVFAAPDLDSQDAVRERGMHVVETRLGWSEPPVLFQAAEFHGWPLDRVTQALKSLSGLPVATLSLGGYAGEDRLLAKAGALAGVPTLADLPADEITSLLACAGAVFTTSMHAAIVGASFGTPVVVPGVGKTKDAFAVLPNPPRLYGSDDAHLAGTISELVGRRENHSTEANREAVVAAFEQTMRAAGML